MNKVLALTSIVIFMAACGFGSNASAMGLNGEFSLMGTYSRTNYGTGAYSTIRRYSTAIGYNLTSLTELELSYTNTRSFFNYEPYSTTMVSEQALGLSLVQSLVPRRWLIQPYVKAGGAQYNRQQSGTTASIANTPSSTKSPSGVLGAGVRIFLLRNFSLKVEGVTFLPEVRLSEARNNFSIQGGAGWYF